MIRKITIQNFKAFKNVEINTRPVNVLMGLNGMGKSTVIQTFLILRQSRDLNRGNISLSDYLIEIGKGKDAMYQYSHQEFIKFSFLFDDLGALTWHFKYNPDSNFLESQEKYDWGRLNEYPMFGNKFEYLKADRQGPQIDYQTSFSEVVNNRRLGSDGRFSVHYLNAFGNEKVKNKALHHKDAKSEILMHQVDAWLSEITPGVKLNTTEIPGTDKVLLDYQFETGSLYTNRFRPKNVGFGLSYALPIVLAILTSDKDKLLILENPESHIHPRGQAELGKLIGLASLSGSQVIVETHSDHILNGIRVAVKRKEITKDAIGIFYFDKKVENEEQYSEVAEIFIDSDGELSDYPKNFMDEWSNQLLKLL